MKRHPVHDSVAALTRRQRQTIAVTPTVRYRVQAPCLLQQLQDAIGVGMETSTTAGRSIPSSRPTVAVDALDLWLEVQTNTHAWAHALDVDRRPYTPGTPSPAGLPPVARLLRHVAGVVTGRALERMADAIHTAAVRWQRQIVAMLHGTVEQRGVRGAECPACSQTTVVERRDDGRVRVPAVVLVQREIEGNALTWLACLACGWARDLASLAPNESMRGASSAELGDVPSCHTRPTPPAQAHSRTTGHLVGYAGAGWVCGHCGERFPAPCPPPEPGGVGICRY